MLHTICCKLHRALLLWTLAASTLLALVAAEVQVFPRVLSSSDSEELLSDLYAGFGYLCCGEWRSEAAAITQRHVADRLNVTVRHMSDVHLENASTTVRGDSAGEWGGFAVFYLEDPGSIEVKLQDIDGSMEDIVGVRQGTLVVADERISLVHSHPLRVAWVRVRHADSSQRGFLEWYAASWARKNFVIPHDTAYQRKFFRAHTRHPKYWHGFVWSFIGMFCTVFACLPLAMWGARILESALCDRHCYTRSHLPPSEAGQGRPSTPSRRPTLLPVVGRGSFNHLPKDILSKQSDCDECQKIQTPATSP
eukprot:TRINITY_DN27117_c0_g1_i1.p1 TRINITY_DN27117_c0_g1~~TRINITY_DN27117_c0_g1_i1.p1  ORF type:complete len:308 (+),score=45.12 TRINITY_DN27117_c0_g1_i1:214-1137(+)